MLVLFADAFEELGRRYVVILKDLAARRGLQGLDAARAADRVVINQHVVFGAQVFQRRSGRLDPFARETRILRQDADLMPPFAQHATHRKDVITHSIRRRECRSENREARHGFLGESRCEQVRNEQVRKRGLPPLVQSKQWRGQAPLPDLFTAKLALHMLNVIGIDVGFAGDDGVVHRAVKKVVQVAGQLIFDFDLCRRNRVELQNFFTTKAACFQQQLHRRNRYRVFVSRIEVEITTTDQQVLRIWRLENDEPARLERAAGFVKKLHERFEWQVLGEVKSRDGIQASIRQRPEKLQRL